MRTQEIKRKIDSAWGNRCQGIGVRYRFPLGSVHQK